jgi:hypothetical protein
MKIHIVLALAIIICGNLMDRQTNRQKARVRWAESDEDSMVQTSTSGWMDDTLVITTFPTPMNAQCDWFIDNLRHDARNRAIRDELRGMGFDAVECGTARGKLR